jgi:lysophospholipase L1-like esterase
MSRSITFVFLIILLAIPVFSQISTGNKAGNPVAEKAAKLPEIIPTETPDSGVFYQAAIRANEKVVFLGDSITEDWRLDVYFPQMRFYINRGIGGETTVSILGRFQSDVIDVHPRVVMILAGINDIAGFSGPMTIEQTRDNLAAMTEGAARNGIRVVLASVMPVNDYCVDFEGNPIIQTALRPPARILALNQLIRAYAAQNRIPYIDYHSAMVDSNGFMIAGLTNDGLHPNATGYTVMKPLALSAIRSALKRKR